MVVPLYKSKGERTECSYYRGISMLVGKIYAGIFVERFHRVTEDKTGYEQGSFRSGKECVDQILGMGRREKDRE